LLLLSCAVYSSRIGVGVGVGVGNWTGAGTVIMTIGIGLIEGYRVWPLARWGRQVGIGVSQDLRLAVIGID